MKRCSTTTKRSSQNWPTHWFHWWHLVTDGLLYAQPSCLAVATSKGCTGPKTSSSQLGRSHHFHEFENDVGTTPEKVRAGFAGALVFVECYVLSLNAIYFCKQDTIRGCTPSLPVYLIEKTTPSAGAPRLVGQIGHISHRRIAKGWR
jgi:hypothetical protein